MHNLKIKAVKPCSEPITLVCPKTRHVNKASKPHNAPSGSVPFQNVPFKEFVEDDFNECSVATGPWSANGEVCSQSETTAMETSSPWESAPPAEPREGWAQFEKTSTSEENWADFSNFSDMTG